MGFHQRCLLVEQIAFINHGPVPGDGNGDVVWTAKSSQNFNGQPITAGTGPTCGGTRCEDAKNLEGSDDGQFSSVSTVESVDGLVDKVLPHDPPEGTSDSRRSGGEAFA